MLLLGWKLAAITHSTHCSFWLKATSILAPVHSSLRHVLLYDLLIEHRNDVQTHFQTAEKNGSSSRKEEDD